MAALLQAQRDAIVRRCAPLIATYFTTSPLRAVDVDYEAVANPPDLVEFHDYLRLATLLPAGKRLCEHLARVDLAPAVEQSRSLRVDRGALTGPVDPSSLARHLGQRATPRQYTVRKITTHHRVPENILAASTAHTLVTELQTLIGRTQLPTGNSEAVLATHILDAAQAALAMPPLSDVADDIVDLRSERFAELLVQVEERWRSRRISNRAYADIARWSHQNRHRRLQPDGLIAGVAYGDDFDNRLFEIFSLSVVRSGMEQLGYAVTELRPLHRTRDQPAVEFVHPDSGTAVDLYFQKAKGVAWSTTAPRVWDRVTGIPDLILASRSPSHPLVLIDAKNRNRGPTTDDDEAADRQDRHATSDELHKMVGYFTNFGRRCRVAGRGPVGGLIYSSVTNTSTTWSTTSEHGGLIVTVALNPDDPDIDLDGGGARALIEPLLHAAGLLGGARPDGTRSDVRLAELHAAHPDDPGDPDRHARTEAISAWIEADYGCDPTRVAAAEQVLATHVLGDAIRHLTVEEMRFLTTAEVFWEDHADAVAMDFGPVVIELAKALESLVNRTLIEPFRVWAAQQGRQPGQVGTIGDQRAELDRVAALQPGQTKPRGALVLSDYLSSTNQRTFVLDHVLPTLTRLNPVRRAAAHPHRITSRAAAETRSWLLGVGPEPSALAHLATNLSGTNP